MRNGTTGVDDAGAPAGLDQVCPQLSRRQIEVLRLLATGVTAGSVARALGISPSTVARHKEVAYRKLGVQSQAHAVSVAIRTGLLEPESAAP